MKAGQKELEKGIWDQMRSPSVGTPKAGSGQQSRALPKILVWLILSVSVTYMVYTLKLVSTSRACDDEPFSNPRHRLSSSSSSSEPNNITESSSPSSIKGHQRTELRNVVFGLAASAKLWEKRKNYIKLWFKPKEMRGVVWLDRSVKSSRGEGLPPVRISGNTSRFPYTNRQGHRSAIRISRIVSETLRLGLEDVHWFVMGDDDTVFVTENLVRILRKYDHNQFYYIGSLSESHLQNIYFSYGMAYGGGGFALSYPLAKALAGMQDRCIQRYPGLYGSDDRMQACMTELGVPLTKELGFHQVRLSFINCRCHLFFNYRCFYFSGLRFRSYRRYFGR
jgi:hypothetical protein